MKIKNKIIYIISACILTGSISIAVTCFMLNHQQREKYFEQYFNKMHNQTTKIEFELRQTRTNQNSKVIVLTDDDAKAFFDCLKLKLPFNEFSTKGEQPFVINLYSNNKLIDILIFHGTSIRFTNAGVRDVIILPESQTILKKFFVKHGIKFKD